MDIGGTHSGRGEKLSQKCRPACSISLDAGGRSAGRGPGERTSRKSYARYQARVVPSRPDDGEGGGEGVAGGQGCQLKVCPARGGQPGEFTTRVKVGQVHPIVLANRGRSWIGGGFSSP